MNPPAPYSPDDATTPEGGPQLPPPPSYLNAPPPTMPPAGFPDYSSAPPPPASSFSQPFDPSAFAPPGGYQPAGRETYRAPDAPSAAPSFDPAAAPVFDPTQPAYDSAFDPAAFAAPTYEPPTYDSGFDPSAFAAPAYEPPSYDAGFDPGAYAAPAFDPTAFDSSSFDPSSFDPPTVDTATDDAIPTFDTGAFDAPLFDSSAFDAPPAPSAVPPVWEAPIAEASEPTQSSSVFVAPAAFAAPPAAPVVTEPDVAPTVFAGPPAATGQPAPAPAAEPFSPPPATASSVTAPHVAPPVAPVFEATPDVVPASDGDVPAADRLNSEGASNEAPAADVAHPAPVDLAPSGEPSTRRAERLRAEAEAAKIAAQAAPIDLQLPAFPMMFGHTETDEDEDEDLILNLGQGQVGTDPDLIAALNIVVSLGASDLHISVGTAPLVRIDGGLQAVPGFDEWDSEKVRTALHSILSPEDRDQFENELELDFAYTLSEESRFRVNIYQQRDYLGAAFRLIPTEIKQLAALGIPEHIGKFAQLPRGLVLVTGPTGSGKSTTLAALIDLVNSTRSDHIVTVEDPIEFMHKNKKSLVNQREVGHDTHSFNNALKHVLRQDPDVILIGELRDLETVSVALTAAETGHLVFATLHTQDAPQTIDRVIDVFPPHQQGQVRAQLAATLQGVVCQTLVKKAHGQGRAVATEVLITTPAVANLIREGKTYQIHSAMQAGREMGMHTMDQHLADLVNARQITHQAAYEKAHDLEDLKQLISRSEGAGAGHDFSGPASAIDFDDSYSGKGI